MSSIDERIVQMRFENAQFEQGVKETMNSISALNHQLAMEESAYKASKSLDTISKAATSVNFDSLNSALDSINYRFSTLGQIASSAIQTITSGVLNLGKGLFDNTIGKTIDQIISGGATRAENLEQARFMMEGLGIDVEKGMNNALNAVKGTAYGLDQAARAVGQLSASGVKLGTDMENTLKGIAGTAAMTGRDFDSVAAIFETVAGNGRLMGMQLTQLSSYGINAAQILGKSLGKTEAEIREMTSKGEISFNQFKDAMNDAFGKHAKEANKTFSGAVMNMNAALSRIGEPFQTIKMENLRLIAISLTDMFDQLAVSLEPAKKIFESLFKLFRKEAINIISNFTDKLKYLNEETKTFKKIGDIIFTVIKNIINVFSITKNVAGSIFPTVSIEKFAGFIDRLHERFEKFSITLKEAREGISKSPALTKLKGILQGIFSAIDIIRMGIIVVAKVLRPIFKAIGRTGIFNKFTDFLLKIANFFTVLRAKIKSADEFWSKLNQFSHMKLGAGIKQFFENISNFFNRIKTGSPFLNKLLENVTKLREFIVSIKNLSFGDKVEQFKEFNAELGIGNVLLSGIMSFLITVIDGFKSFGKQIAENFKNFKANLKNDFFGTIKDTLSDNKSWGDSFKDVFTGMGANFMATIEGLGEVTVNMAKGIGTAITKTIEYLFAGLRDLTTEDILNITKAIKTIVETLIGLDILGLVNNLRLLTLTFRQLFADFGVTVQGSLITNMKILAGCVLELVAAVFLLALIPHDRLLVALASVTALSIIVLGMLKQFKTMSRDVSVKQVAVISSTLTSIGFAMGMLAIAVSLMAHNDPIKLATAIAGFAIMCISIENFLKSIKNIAKGMTGKEVAKFLVIINSLIPMAIAMGMFGIALKIIQAGKIEKTILGMISFYVILEVIFSFINKIDNQITKVSKIVAVSLAMIPLAMAIMVMVGAVAILGHMNPEKLAIGFVAISGLLAVISIFSNSLNDTKGIVKVSAAILIMAAAMTILVGSVAILAQLKIDQLENGLIGLASIIALIVVMTHALNKEDGMVKVGAGLLIMSVGILIISQAFKQMSDIDTQSLLYSTIALGGCIAALALLGVVFKGIKAKEVLSMSVAMIAFSVTIKSIAGAFKEMDGLDNTMKSLLVMSVSLIAMAAAVLILGAASAEAIVGSLSLILIAASVTVLAKAFTEFDKLKKPWEIFGLIAASIATLAGFSLLLAALSPVLLIAALGMGVFSKSLVKLSKAFLNMAEAYDKTNGKMTAMADEFIAALIRVAEGLGDVGDAFKESLSRIIDNAIEIFISKIPALVGAIWQMLTQLSNAFSTYAPIIADNILTGLTGILNVIAENLWNGGGIVGAMDNLGSAFMTTLLRSLASNLSDDISHPLQKTLRDLLLGTADEQEANAALARKQGKEIVDNMREGAEAEAASSDISGGITSFLGSGGGIDFSSIFGGGDLTSFLGGLDLSSTDANGLMSSLTSALGDSGTPMMENLGENLGQDGLQSLLDQFNNGDINLDTFSDKLSGAMELEDSGDEQGKEFNKALKKSLEDNAGKGEEGAKTVKKKIKKQFGKGSKEMKNLGEAGGKNYINNLLDKISDGEIDVETAVSRLNDILSGKNLPEGYGALSDKALSDIENETKKQQLISASETLGQEGVVDPLKNSIESDQAISAISGAGDNATEAASGTEAAQSALYSQMYDKGKNATQGLADGLMDSQAVQAVQSHAKAVAKTLLDGINHTLDEHSPSEETKQQGIYAVLGLALGLEDKASNKRIVDNATTMASSITGTLESELEIHSPSKKLERIATYAAEGFNKGLKKIAKKNTITNVAKKITKQLTKMTESMHTTLTKGQKKIVNSFNKISSKLELKPNSKKLQKQYVKIANQIDRLQAKYRTKRQLFKSTDEYEDLKSQLKDSRKERKKILKQTNKWAGKTSGVSKSDVKNLSSMQKKYKELTKAGNKISKADKKRADQLKKYIDSLKDINKEIKKITKEIGKGFAKADKEWKKTIKETNLESFHDLFLNGTEATFEIFTSGMTKSLDILGVSADKVVDVLSGGTSDTADSVKILTNSIGKLSNVMQSAYDTAIDLFSEFNTTWYNPSEVLSDMNDNLKGYDEWRNGIKKLKSGIGKDIAESLEDSGFSAETLSQLRMYLGMSSSQLQEAVDYMTQKLIYEKDTYVSNMKKTVNDYQEWTENISKLTGKLSDDVLQSLKDMGVEGSDYVKMFLLMDDDDIKTVEDAFAAEASNATNAYFENIKKQLSTYSKWQDNLNELSSDRYGFSEAFLEDIKAMGVEGAEYVSQLLNMSDEQRKELQGLYKESATAQAHSYIEDMQAPIDQYQNWISNLAKLESEGKLSAPLLEELRNMGAEGYEIVKKFTDMSDEDIQQANKLYLEQRTINADNYLLQMRKEVADYQKWVENMNTLENAGLNNQLLRELMEAGVESSDKVEELVQLISQGQLADINKLYKESQKGNANSLLNQMRTQAEDWEEYYKGMSWITNNTDLDASLIEKLKEMGLDALDYIREIKAMSDTEIAQLNKYGEAEKAITADNLLLSIRDNKKKISEWGDMLQQMAKQGYNSSLIQQLAEQGYEASYDAVKAYTSMTTAEVGEVNSMWESEAMAQKKALSAIYKSNTQDAIDAQKKAADAFKKEGATTWSSTGQEIADIFGDNMIRRGMYYNEQWTDVSASWMEGLTEDQISAIESAYGQMTAAGAINGTDTAKSEVTAMLEIINSETTTSSLTNAGTSLADTISNAYISELSTLAKKVQHQIILTCRPTTGTGNTRDKIKTGFKNLAAQCATGFANVLKSSDSVKKVQNAAYYMAKGALTAAKKALGINSPSKEFGYLADYSIEGYVNNMQAGTTTAGAAGKSMADAVLAQASSVVTGLQEIGKQSDIGFGIEPIFDSDSTVRGLAAIEDMVQAKNMAVQSLSFDNLSDINTLTTLNDSLNNLTTAISGMESYAERLDNIETLLGTYLPDATTDIYLDGDKVSSYVENTITNNLVRRRAGW